MADFNKAYKKTMAIEGGYANDATDLGGETWKGIARNRHPEWSGWKIVDQYRSHANFPSVLGTLHPLQEKVWEFYKVSQWDVLRLDRVNNQDIAEEIFDTGVNQGIPKSAEHVQRALNLLNRNQKDYKDIVVDRNIGPQTLELINNHKYPLALRKLLNVLQGARYVEICEANKSQEENMRGWLERVAL